MTGRLPSPSEQAFLLKLAYLLVERQSVGLSFELDGPRLCLTAHPPYGPPARVVVRVDKSGYRALTEHKTVTTVHDVAQRLVARARRGLG